jgi:hypothetical protein
MDRCGEIAMSAERGVDQLVRHTFSAGSSRALDT